MGLIGVVLFIGLALAGASFLGPYFQRTAMQTQSVAVTTQMSQTAQAIQMYRLKTGQTGIPLGTTAFLVPRFLKAEARNMSPGGVANPNDYRYSVHINNDVLGDANDEGAPLAGAYIMMFLGTDTKARDVCKAIADVNNGGTMVAIDSTNRYPQATVGCGIYNSNTYVAFHRI